MNMSTRLGPLDSVHRRMLVVALFLALSVTALAAPAVADATDDASLSVALVNQSRAAHGLYRLTPDGELQSVAQRHAHRMAEHGYISHSEDLGWDLSWGWWGWAENVGYGPSVSWIHNAFMNSWYHSSNILSASYNHVGVGVAYGSDGRVYVAQVFGAW